VQDSIAISYEEYGNWEIAAVFMTHRLSLFVYPLEIPNRFSYFSYVKFYLCSLLIAGTAFSKQVVPSFLTHAFSIKEDEI